ncbi:MAG TPA: GMC family oxidoreductase, partial [Leptospiraceae bacterium]|nr:GMC family oxidoreductase [Leptospiraceae bacterium]
LDVPTTAHILGGAIIGETENQGVVDLQNRVFGYKNLMVCDGSMVPANLGVNPSLTITALSERAMSYVPPKEGKEQKFFQYEKSWSITDVLKRTKSSVQIPLKSETVSITDNKKTKEKKKAVSGKTAKKKTASKSKTKKK